MDIRLKYGKGYKDITISDKADVTVLNAASVPPLDDVAGAANRALDALIGLPALETFPVPRTVAIAVPDPSRPVPFRDILPVLLERLYRTFPSLRPEDVTIVIGGGLHPPLGGEAMAAWLPAETAPGCRVTAHDAVNSPMMDFGTTALGTPVAINAEYGRADLKIVIGQIDPHQFVGFTGGAKGVIIGCASARTIEHNHGLMFREGAMAGRVTGNPVRQDQNEAGRLAGVDLAINAVMDPAKKPVGIWAGKPELVLEEGAKVSAMVYGVVLDGLFDLVLASCGGHPKDICLYQAQKGLNLASHALEPGGRIALVAACEEGVGDDVYYDYSCRFESIEAALADFRQLGFKMGAHKCYLFGKTLTRFEVVVDSELDAATLKNCHLQAGSAQEAMDRWIAAFPGRPRVAVVPNANTTYFQVK